MRCSYLMKVNQNSYQKNYGINVLIMIVFGLLLVFGMLIFYHGRYGNIFSMIGMALLAIIKWILKLLLMLRGDDDTVMDDYIEETTTSLNQ